MARYISPTLFPRSPTSPFAHRECSPDFSAVGGEQTLAGLYGGRKDVALFSSPFPVAADREVLSGDRQLEYYPTPKDIETLMQSFDTPADTPISIFQDSVLESPAGGVDFAQLGVTDDFLFHPYYDQPDATISTDQLFNNLAVENPIDQQAPGSPLIQVKEEDYHSSSPVMEQESAGYDSDEEKPAETPVHDSSSRSRLRRPARSSNSTYPCPLDFCGKTFTRKYNLLTHISTHNPDRPRPFECLHCNKRFLRQHDLERHETVHSKAKNYVCTTPGCGKTFTRQDAVRRHLRNTRCLERLTADD